MVFFYNILFDQSLLMTETNVAESRLSVFGATKMAQRKRRNSENNRLGLGLG